MTSQNFCYKIHKVHINDYFNNYAKHMFPYHYEVSLSEYFRCFELPLKDILHLDSVNCNAFGKKALVRDFTWDVTCSYLRFEDD